MGATGLRVVGYQHITGSQVAHVQVMLVFHGVAHTSKVDRYVTVKRLASYFLWMELQNTRCIGNQLAIWAEDGTGEIQALFDV